MREPGDAIRCKKKCCKSGTRCKRCPVVWKKLSRQGYAERTAKLHYVVIESKEDSAESIMPEDFTRFGGRFRLVAPPTTDDYHFINMMELETLGLHVAKVYRVNEEYAELYENRTQDSRDLNEPPSNIHGGLGVFSAFNSDSVFFQVAREESS